MHVLEHGHGRPWSQRYRCTGAGDGLGNGGCNALLLVEQSDLYVVERLVDGDRMYWICFRCPECRSETHIDEVPAAIQRSLTTGPLGGKHALHR